MRIIFSNSSHALTVAKNLKKRLAALDLSLKLGKAQDFVAFIFGYENWAELHSCLDCEMPSQWDDQLEMADVARRQITFTERLSKISGLDFVLASTIIDDLRPMARRTVGKALEPWRAILIERTAFGRLLSVEHDDPKQIVEWLRKANARKRSSVSMMEVEEGEVFLERGPIVSEGQLFQFNVFLVSGEDVLGVIEGAVLKTRYDLTPDEFYAVCDDAANAEDPWQCGDLLEMGSNVANQIGDDPVVDNEAAVMLWKWEIKLCQLKRGTGRTFLNAAMDLLRPGIRKRIKFLAVKVAPAQFSDMDIDERLSSDTYKAAVDHLKAHLTSSKINESVGPKAQLFLIDEERPYAAHPWLQEQLRIAAHTQEGRGELEALAQRRHSPADWVGNERMPGFVGERFYSKITVTDQSEPQALVPWRFPVDFHPPHATNFKMFKPHPSLWQHMPSDLLRITLVYPLRDKPKSVATVEATYWFRNGTSLSLDEEDFLFGERFERIAGCFMPRGVINPENPFTDKYSVGDLSEVLKINSLLLFAGNLSGLKCLEYPEEPVQVVRPIQGRSKNT